MAGKKKDDDVIDLEEITEDRRQGRRGDGGVYLVVADESEEFGTALRYAARRAEKNRAHVGILHCINVEDFQHWSNVEARMKAELREQTEKYIWNVAKEVNDLNGLIPVLYIREGNLTDVIVDVINEDLNIKNLILAGGTANSGPGPLVNHFTGKGLARLRVPVVVVPGYLDQQKIDFIGS